MSEQILIVLQRNSPKRIKHFGSVPGRFERPHGLRSVTSGQNRHYLLATEVEMAGKNMVTNKTVQL